MLNPKHQAPNIKQLLSSKTQTSKRFGFNFFVLLACFGFVILNFIFSQEARATDISLVVSPPRTDLAIKPGETLQKTIKVTNTSSEELILSAEAIDFIVNDDAGTPIKVTTEASGRFLASPWFTLETSELVVPPKETSTLTVIITAPKDALPGGHYAGIFFEPKERRGEKKTVSYTNAQVGSLFALNVEGDIKYDAVIKDFSVKNYLSEFGPIDFSLTLENQSDTHISPETSIVVTDMLGRKFEPIKLDSINIFPFTGRTQTARWEQIWGFGKYVATVSVVYGPSGAITSRDLPFYIIPYRLIAAILVVLLVIIATSISIKRHLMHRYDQRDNEIDELKRKIAELENNTR